MIKLISKFCILLMQIVAMFSMGIAGAVCVISNFTMAQASDNRLVFLFGVLGIIASGIAMWMKADEEKEDNAKV